MTKAATRVIEKQKISKLQDSSVGLEENLESWIEQDPSLVQSGLTIVSRQLIIEGGRLDVLALDPQGRWVVIEVKAGLLDSPVITQALYYVAHIASMDYVSLESKVNKYLAKKNTELKRLMKELGVGNDLKDSRDVYAIVVGTGRTTGLGKLLGFMAEKYGFPISAVLYDVFEMPDGKKIVSRDLTDLESGVEKIDDKEKSKWTLQDLTNKAADNGVSEEINLILDVAKKLELYARPYANSVMITPPQNKTRLLFTFWIKPNKDKKLKAFVGSDMFPDFYPVSEKESVKLLGKPGWRYMNNSQVKEFLKALESLFQKIDEQSKSS